jgi:hypothetical protein
MCFFFFRKDELQKNTFLSTQMVHLKSRFFLKQRLKFLGHCVSSKGIEPDPARVKKVQNCPTPTSVTGIKSFIGLASYYRRFIKDFSKIAHPMLELVKKDVPFVWTERQEGAFQKLKKCYYLCFYFIYFYFLFRCHFLFNFINYH